MVPLSRKFWSLPLALLSLTALAAPTAIVLTTFDSTVTPCSDPPTRFHVPEPPYDNYFASDCHSSTHVLVRTQKSPRLLVAWPAGNSGIAAFFEPENGGSTLNITLEGDPTDGQVLNPIALPGGEENPNLRVGVEGAIHFDQPAILTVPILGSIRTIREYTEGGGHLTPEIQNGVMIYPFGNSGASVYRTWFDGLTTTWLEFTPKGSAEPTKIIPGDKYTIRFGAGTYAFSATFNYKPLKRMSPQQVLNAEAQGLIAQYPDQTNSLSFLSYEDKLLAGTWRFLTYFGRDSILSALLMEPILSRGKESAMEAILRAAMDRMKEDGAICHEEAIGDYATYINMKNGVGGSSPLCDYKMIDTDFLFPVLVQAATLNAKGQLRDDIDSSWYSSFFNNSGPSEGPNTNKKYLELLKLNANRIMNLAAPFANQPIVGNLIHLKDGEHTGQWRDSNNGLGGGRIPYDVNTALVPAALRAIAALEAPLIGNSWMVGNASEYAKVWEEKTLQFFSVSIPKADAQRLVSQYKSSTALAGPSNTGSITGPVNFFGLALDGTSDAKAIPVMNTDDCFRLFLLNPALLGNQSQHSAFIEQAADNILMPFPAGLSTAAGLLVANPAYNCDTDCVSNFKNTDYHGTVIWSWQLAMMAAGLEHQLRSCSSEGKPDFCTNAALKRKVVNAYNHLWDLIDNNKDQLSGEMWSWKYVDDYEAVPFSSYSNTESNIRQLWSLTFLANTRKEFCACV